LHIHHVDLAIAVPVADGDDLRGVRLGSGDGARAERPGHRRRDATDEDKADDDRRATVPVPALTPIATSTGGLDRALGSGRWCLVGGCGRRAGVGDRRDGANPGEVSTDDEGHVGAVEVDDGTASIVVVVGPTPAPC